MIRYTLKFSGKRLLFVTNNATKSRKSYKGKFDELGVQAAVVRPVPTSHRTQVTESIHSTSYCPLK